MEIHVKTPRALVLFKHLVYLGYIAGWDITQVTRNGLENRWMPSLHSHHGIVTHARENMDKGLVPKNWFELFSKQIDEQSKS